MKKMSVSDKFKMSERARKYCLVFVSVFSVCCIFIGTACRLAQPPSGTPEFIQFRESLVGFGANAYIMGFMFLPVILLCTKIRWRSFLLALLVMAVLSVALAVTGRYLDVSFQTDRYYLLFSASGSLFVGCLLTLWMLFLGSLSKKQ